ncbi:rhodanese-like domain-containing protein, partial [Staphylococcus epidermidis]
YQYHLPHFRAAIPPHITPFPHLPQSLPNNKQQLDPKNILTYSTPPIPSQKFSRSLLKQPFQSVAQFHGPVATY